MCFTYSLTQSYQMAGRTAFVEWMMRAAVCVCLCVGCDFPHMANSPHESPAFFSFPPPSKHTQTPRTRADAMTDAHCAHLLLLATWQTRGIRVCGGCMFDGTHTASKTDIGECGCGDHAAAAAAVNVKLWKSSSIFVCALNPWKKNPKRARDLWQSPGWWVGRVSWYFTRIYRSSLYYFIVL